MTSRRVLLVGAGTMGRQHADAARVAGDRVVAVVDTDQIRGSSIDSAAGVFPSIEEALGNIDDIDSAIVATPSVQHLSDCVQLIGHGVDVLVEKPHRVPGQDPGELIRAFGKGGRLFIGMSTRHWPGVKQLLGAIGDGELGDILSYVDRMQYKLETTSLPDWYFDPAVSGGGALTTNGVHAIDRARAILGNDLSLVDASRRKVFSSHSVEDHASVLAISGQASVFLDISWVTYNPESTGIVVTGTRGRGFVGMDGAWSIETSTSFRSGPPIDVIRDPFLTQWTSFSNGDQGFDLPALEPTLAFIEKVYEEVELV